MRGCAGEGCGVMDTELVAVRLGQVPVGLYARAARHQQALQREFDVIVSGKNDPASFPSVFLEVIGELHDQFGRFAAPGHAELEEAVARADGEVDVVYRVPPQARAAALRLGRLLDRADDYCRAGTHLLTMATPAHVLLFREWFLGEFIGQ